MSEEDYDEGAEKRPRNRNEPDEEEEGTTNMMGIKGPFTPEKLMEIFGKGKVDGDMSPAQMFMFYLMYSDMKDRREDKKDRREERKDRRKSEDFRDYLLKEDQDHKHSRDDKEDSRIIDLQKKLSKLSPNDQKSFLHQCFDDVEGQVKDIVVKSFFKGEGEVSKHEYLKIIDKVLDTVKEVALKIMPTGEIPDEQEPKTYDVEPEDEDAAPPPPLQPASSVEFKEALEAEESIEVPGEEVVTPAESQKRLLVEELLRKTPPEIPTQIPDMETPSSPTTRSYEGTPEPEEEEPEIEEDEEIVEEEVQSAEIEEETTEKPRRGRGRPPKAKKTEG